MAALDQDILFIRTNGSPQRINELISAIDQIQNDANETLEFVKDFNGNIYGPNDLIVNSIIYDPAKDQNTLSLKAKLNELNRAKIELNRNIQGGALLSSPPLSASASAVTNTTSRGTRDPNQPLYRPNVAVFGSALLSTIDGVLREETNIINGLINKLTDIQFNELSLLRDPVLDIERRRLYRGAGFISNKLKTNAEVLRRFMETKYGEAKEYLSKVVQSQVKRYEGMSIIGRMTYVEGAFLRLLQFCIKRTIGRIIPVTYLSKTLHFISIFTSFTGVTMPPVLAAMGMTSLEALVKLALISGGAHTMGILLGTNICIFLLYFVKKTIDTKGQNIKNMIKVILDKIATKAIDQVEQTVNDALQIPEIDLGSTNGIKAEAGIIDNDDDPSAIQSLFSTTFGLDITNNIALDEDAIKDPSDSIDKDIRLKIPKSVDAKILKKVACSLIESIEVTDATKVAFQEKLQKIGMWIDTLNPAKGGSSCDDKILRHLMRNSQDFLSEYYYYKTGQLPNGKWTKEEVTRKIITFSKSHKS